MKPPSPAAYLIGNPVSVTAIFLVGGLVIVGGLNGQFSNTPALVIAFVAIIAAGNAGLKVSKYHTWKRAWDAMGSGGTVARRSWIRPVLGVAFLAVVAVCLAGLDYRRIVDKHMVYEIACGLLVLLVVGLYRHRRARSVGQGSARKDIPVSIAGAVPRDAPGRRQFMRNLPSYCGPLS